MKFTGRVACDKSFYKKPHMYTVLSARVFVSRVYLRTISYNGLKLPSLKWSVSDVGEPMSTCPSSVVLLPGRGGRIENLSALVRTLPPAVFTWTCRTYPGPSSPSATGFVRLSAGSSRASLAEMKALSAA